MGLKHILIVLSVLLFSCKSAVAPPVKPKAPIVEATAPVEEKFDTPQGWQKYETNNISFSVPGDWNKSISDDPDSDVSVSFFSSEESLMLIYAEQSFDGNLKAYARSVFTEFRDEDAEFKDGSFIKVDSVNVIEAIFFKQHVGIVVFVTVKNSYGHVMYCAGLQKNLQIVGQACEAIMLTVKFK